LGSKLHITNLKSQLKPWYWLHC